MHAQTTKGTRRKKRKRQLLKQAAVNQSLQLLALGCPLEKEGEFATA